MTHGALCVSSYSFTMVLAVSQISRLEESETDGERDQWYTPVVQWKFCTIKKEHKDLVLFCEVLSPVRLALFGSLDSISKMLPPKTVTERRI